MKWFAVFLTVGCLLPGSLVLTRRLSEVDGRIHELESQTHAEGRFLQRYASELLAVRGELAAIERSLQAGETGELARRLNEAESRLMQLGDTLGAQTQRLVAIAEAQSELDPEVLEARLELHDRTQDQQLADLRRLAEQAATLAEDTIAQIEVLSTGIDPQELWRDLVGPVVQLAGDSSVGSGVLLESVPTDDPEVFTTYVLTAWHVVRDIQGDPSNRDMPIPVTRYRPDGSLVRTTASLLEHDAPLDVALLRLDSDEPAEYGATLAPPSLLEAVTTFHGVIAVGCPLGNDPIPTRGEVASVRHRVDDEYYWMINAPTYIGNSGGAIFDAESRDLLGIFSKIYTHGSLRPTVVPHMGLVRPMDDIYAWMGSVGYGRLVPGGGLRSVARAE